MCGKKQMKTILWCGLQPVGQPKKKTWINFGPFWINCHNRIEENAGYFDIRRFFRSKGENLCNPNEKEGLHVEI